MSKLFKLLTFALCITLVAASCGQTTETEEPANDEDANAENNSNTDEVEENQSKDDEDSNDTGNGEAQSNDADNNETASADVSDNVVIDLVEWDLTSDKPEIKAGKVKFTVKNSGNNKHKFGIARGDSYETLPQEPNGAVDEAALGEDFLGDTKTLESGEETTIEFDLAPGNYVFMCNISFGPNAHVAQGQVLSVTVVE